jgi:hypothetical protein
MSRATRRLLAAGTLVLSGCDVLPQEPADAGVDANLPCQHELHLEGNVAGVDVDASGYVLLAQWYNDSTEVRALDWITKESMVWLGLDPLSDDDLARYYYWSSAFDLRVLERENLRMGTLAPVDRELGVYLYDLTANAVQPDTEVQIFDISSIEALRNAGDREALGEEVRRLVDTMRDNGQADAVVGFSRDRSEEELPFTFLINMFAPDTRFASAGQVTFYNPIDAAGRPVSSFVHPIRDVSALSIRLDVTFGADAVRGRDECLPLTIYNP